MAGHSKFKNIMHRKGAQDKKRAKVFSKIIRELTVAAKAGDDIDSNPALRLAISKAKTANMPKDTTERAIAKGAGGADGDNYEEVRYEGYGTGGVAVIVDALTDNRNRAASEIRAAFTKSGGNLGESGSVSFMFDRVGTITYPQNKADEETMFEAAIDAGAENMEINDDGNYEITTAFDQLHQVRDALEKKFGEPESAEIIWKPNNTTEVSDKDKAEKLFKLIDALEDLDDVQTVTANFDIPEDILNLIG